MYSIYLDFVNPRYDNIIMCKLSVQEADRPCSMSRALRAYPAQQMLGRQGGEIYVNAAVIEATTAGSVARANYK